MVFFFKGYNYISYCIPIVAPTHIVAGHNICWFSRHIFTPLGIYCHPDEIFTLHILSSATIHAKVCRIYVAVCTEREIERGERERGYMIIFIKLKILKFPVCVHPQVDGPSWYDRRLQKVYHVCSPYSKYSDLNLNPLHPPIPCILTYQFIMNFLLTRGPQALTITYMCVSETLHWLLVKRAHICIYQYPHRRINKRPRGPNGHLSIRDSTPTFVRRAHICISTATS